MKKCQCSFLSRCLKCPVKNSLKSLRFIPVILLTLCIVSSTSAKAMAISSANEVEDITTSVQSEASSTSSTVPYLLPNVMHFMLSEVVAPQLDIVKEPISENMAKEAEKSETPKSDKEVSEPVSAKQPTEYIYKNHPEDWPSTWYYYKGEVLTRQLGMVKGPSGKETYYNLPMNGVINIMKNSGYNYTYWIRSDGAKMYGGYIMVAADLRIRPRGTIVKTTLGMGIVCDTGSFIYSDPYQIDIAVNW